MPGVLLQSAPNVSAKDFKFPRATYITLSRTHTLIHTLIQVNCYKNCRKKIIFIHFRNSPHVATVNQLNRIKNSVFSYGYVATATLSFSVHSIQNLVLTVQRPAEWLYQRRHASQKLFFFFMGGTMLYKMFFRHRYQKSTVHIKGYPSFIIILGLIFCSFG